MNSAALLLAMSLAAVRPALAGTWEIQRAASRAERGFNALADGDIEEAKKRFESAVHAQPEFPASHIGLGHAAMIEKRFEAALAEYRLARAGYGLLGEAIHDLEMSRYEANQRLISKLRDEEIRMQRTPDARSKDVRMLPPQGGMRPRQVGTQSEGAGFAQRRLDLANLIARLQAVEPPLKGSSGEAPGEIDFYIGNALYHLEFIEEARISWESCAAKSPSFALVQNNLAVLHSRQGRFDEARACFGRAEALGFEVDPQAKADLARLAPVP